MVPDADLRIKLPVFEGPLDLLLFLIRKNELDIYDIPIATVTRQYIEVIRSMRELDLDIAGEFFVMAASLMEIKSRMLLPRGQAATGEVVDDDPLDPRWELVHQLLQYKKFKEAAAKLDELASFQRDMLARHVVEIAVTENERPLKPVDRIELWNSFNIVLRRLAEKLVVGEIKGEEVTVSDKMEELLRLIQTHKKFLFTELFDGRAVTVRVLVATFIAVLELTRLKKLRVRQDEAYSDIFVEAVEEAPASAADTPPETLALESITPSGETIAADVSGTSSDNSSDLVASANGAPGATLAAIRIHAADGSGEDLDEEASAASEVAPADHDDSRPLAFVPTVIGSLPDTGLAAEPTPAPPEPVVSEPSSDPAPESLAGVSEASAAPSSPSAPATENASADDAPPETENPLETPGEGRTLAP